MNLSWSAPRQQVQLRKFLVPAGFVRVDDEGHAAVLAKAFEVDFGSKPS